LPDVNVFISYRRDDSAGHAGRLRDSLEQAVGRGQVFQDVTSLAPGEHFADAIARSIDAADVVLVVIGRHWVDARDGAGRRRLEDPADVVRVEVETALAAERRTVPVLVDGAVMPAAADLPPSIAPLVEAHAAALHDGSWSADVDRLVRTAGLGGDTVRRRRRRVALAVIGLATLALAATAVVLRWPRDPDDADGGTAPTTAAGVAPVPTAAPAAGDCPSEPAGERQPAPAEPGDEGEHLSLRVEDWWSEPAGAERQTVHVDVWVATSSEEGWSLEPSNFAARSGGVAYENLFCYQVLEGLETLGPAGQARLLLTGTLRDATPLELYAGGLGSPDPAVVTLAG